MCVCDGYFGPCPVCGKGAYEEDDIPDYYYEKEE